MRLTTLFLLLSFTILISCKTNQLQQSASPKIGMIKVSILYPNEEGKTFDMDYYEKTHMPMMANFLGKNLKFYEIDKGVAGRTPTDKIPFVAIGYFYCYKLTEYNEAIAKNITAIVNDIPKYTNIQPIVQISEIEFLSR
ncbi:MAG: EthD family reductase [Flavihumibacter sp.]|jgi:uncharacterized protein (TIGR02118 family)|nr:EthD family reductase [Flavihumibacter sp.]